MLFLRPTTFFQSIIDYLTNPSTGLDCTVKIERMKILSKIRLLDEAINTPVITDLKVFEGIVPKINLAQTELTNLPEDDLRNLAIRTKSIIRSTKDASEHVISTFALIKEICFRSTNLQAYDVQLIAGLAMLEGNLVEMQTGEGKSLAALFPLIFHALHGGGAQLLTFNDYLARRDAQWSLPIAGYFDLSVDFLLSDMSQEDSQKVFQADIVYSSAEAMAYCYLRDRNLYFSHERILPQLNFVIVDEADAILIDQAKNPLVLAGDVELDLPEFKEVDLFVRDLELDIDYRIGKYARNIYLIEAGYTKLDIYLKINNVPEELRSKFLSAVNLSLHAHKLLSRDEDYIVRKKEVKLIDRETGRVLADRKWRNGLQSAVEAKEGVPIQSEGTIMQSTTFNHFLGNYKLMSGMTATAREASSEFMDYYGVSVVVIAPRELCRRIDLPDRVFSTRQHKMVALVDKIKSVHASGQPILVGTRHIKESEQLHDYLGKNGIDCQILNAKNDFEEARIIAGAGTKGSVVISTNMAGRGTDIKLGAGLREAYKEVSALGGLFVLGTNRHESRRIDRQLIGRAGRQGDVGSSQFFVSLEDQIIVHYAQTESIPKALRGLDGEYLQEDEKAISFFDHAQEVLDGQNYQLRKTTHEFSKIIHLQSELIHADRAEIVRDPATLNTFLKVSDSRIDNQSEVARYMALTTIDQAWAEFLSDVQEKKEAIGFVRLGGVHPLREFQKYADGQFSILVEDLGRKIRAGCEKISNSENHPAHDFLGKRPSSTWAYIVNDKLFADQLAMLLLGPGNIGMQVDPISAFLLFGRSLWKSFFKKSAY